MRGMPWRSHRQRSVTMPGGSFSTTDVCTPSLLASGVCCSTLGRLLLMVNVRCALQPGIGTGAGEGAAALSLTALGVGAFVGFGVGFDVGKLVGTGVGDIVGNAVGEAVGEAVGAGAGAAVVDAADVGAAEVGATVEPVLIEVGGAVVSFSNAACAGVSTTLMKHVLKLSL